jgi:hypothetical protein
MCELPEDYRVGNMDLRTDIELAFKPSQPAPVVIGNRKCKDVEDKMYPRIIGNDRSDSCAHTAKIMVIDAERNMERRLHGPCLRLRSVIGRSIHFIGSRVSRLFARRKIC